MPGTESWKQKVNVEESARFEIQWGMCVWLCVYNNFCLDKRNSARTWVYVFSLLNKGPFIIYGQGVNIILWRGHLFLEGVGVIFVINIEIRDGS